MLSIFTHVVKPVRDTHSETGGFTIYGKNRLVGSCGKWDASNPKWKFSLGCARSISTTFPEDRIKGNPSQKVWN